MMILDDTPDVTPKADQHYAPECHASDSDIASDVMFAEFIGASLTASILDGQQAFVFGLWHSQL